MRVSFWTFLFPLNVFVSQEIPVCFSLFWEASPRAHEDLFHESSRNAVKVSANRAWTHQTTRTRTHTPEVSVGVRVCVCTEEACSRGASPPLPPAAALRTSGASADTQFCWSKSAKWRTGAACANTQEQLCATKDPYCLTWTKLTTFS